MIIDSHQHFWKYDSVRDSWIDDTMKIIQRDFLPADLEPVLKTNNVDGCIAVQADQSEQETEFLLDLAKNNKFIKGVVGWVNLSDTDVENRLKYFSQDTLFKGVRHILQAEKDDFMLDNWKTEDFTQYIDVIFEEFGAYRIMYGSDWPVCLLSGNYSKTKEIVTTYIKKLSSQEQQQVMGLNAIEFYGITI